MSVKYRKEQLLMSSKISNNKSKKKFGLVWDSDKVKEKIVIESKQKIPFIWEQKEKLISSDKVSPTHLLIEGDNYPALLFLKEIYNKQIDVIYIDPPYNTGRKDFVYNDKIIDKDDNYRHSKWLNFMKARLELAKSLLSENGVLICSIGEDELANLILLLKEIFNFVSEPLVWLSKSPTNQNKITKTSAICHEYIIVAANKEVESKPEIIDIEKEKSDFALNKLKRYPLGIFLNKDLTDYPIFTKGGKKIVLIPPGDYQIGPYRKNSFKGHRFQKRTFQKGHGSERYIRTYLDLLKELNKSEDHLGVFLNVKDRNNLGVKFVLGKSYFQSISRFVTFKMPSFLGFYQGGYPNFPSAKPVALIKRLIKNYSQPDSIILDFFAGTGTTGQAVLELNHEDNGIRKFILVNNDENNILSRFCYTRLKKFITNLR